MDIQLEFKLALEGLGFVDVSYSDRVIFQRKTNNTNLIVAVNGNRATVHSGYVTEDKTYTQAMNGKGLEIAVARASLQQLTGDEW